MVIIITGATSGIGLETAKLLSKKHIVYALSRTTLNIPNINYISCDLLNYQRVNEVIKEIYQKEKVIDCLINNAGMGISGAMEMTSNEAIKKIIDLNILALVNITNEIIPLLRANPSKKKYIINIGSVAGLLPIPFQTMYSMTKSAINSYSLALANELKPFNIKVTCVNPGDTVTSFTKNRVKNINDGVYSERVNRSVSRMEKDEMNGVKPSVVSKVIAKVINKKNPKPVIVVGFNYKLLVFLKRLLPIKFINKIIYRLYAK